MADNTYVVLRKNLLLLAIARGAIFWYAIEKLFQLHIGLTLQQIVYISIIAQGSKVLFELPTSVIADRWNRRNTLVAANVAMVICVLFLGLANSLPIYIIGTLWWALSDALSSGVYAAFAYDSLATNNLQHKFKKVYTRMVSLELGTMAIAGILAGILGKFINLRLSYFLTLLPMLASMWILLRMQEPAIVRTVQSGASWIKHLGGSFQIMKSKNVRWVITIYIALIGFTAVWYEYFQLLGIDVRVPTVLFGSLIAILTLGMTVGAELSHKFTGTRKLLIVVWLVIIATHLLGLRSSQAIPALLNLFVVFVVMKMLNVYLELHIHDHISSERRATILSLAGTLGYTWFICLAFGFSFFLGHLGVRGALIIASLPLMLLGAIDILKRNHWATRNKPDSSPDTIV